jgi:RNA polymerase sigma factor (sigma-70 family)
MDDSAASDQQAFMDLLEPQLAGAYRLAYGMLRDQPEAEDAVQEAVLKAWRSFGRFRRDSPLRPWLFTIVANECRRRRGSRWWSVIRPEPSEREDPSPRSGDEAAAADLRNALQRLPHDERLVLVLRYYLDLSFAEVAQTLGITAKAAQSRTYRALERLRLSPEVLSDE